MQQAEINKIRCRPVGELLEAFALAPVMGVGPVRRVRPFCGGLEFHEGTSRLALSFQRDVRPADAWIVEFRYDRQRHNGGEGRDQVSEQLLKRRGEASFRRVGMSAQELANSARISFEMFDWHRPPVCSERFEPSAKRGERK